MKRQATITPEQRQALRQQGRGPVYLVDAASEDQYVLLPADEYRHFQALFETDEFDISETYRAQEEAASAVWGDPSLDEYSEYDAHRKDT